MKRPSKKTKPSFDVARGPIGDSAAGWVYRSDPTAADIAIAPSTALSAAPKPARTPARESPPRPMGRRIESGAHLLLTPFTLPLMMLFAKMRWVIGPRAGR